LEGGNGSGSGLSESVAGVDGLTLRSARRVSRDTSQSLLNAKRAAAESEAIGVETLRALKEQGETLQRAHGKLEEASENLTRSEKILKKMGGWFSCWKPEELNKKGMLVRARSYVIPGMRIDTLRANESTIGASSVARVKRDADEEGRGTEKMSNQEFFQGGGYEAERLRQDKELDELSGLVGNLKNLSTALGAELEAQDPQIDDLGYDVEVTGARIKGAARRAGKLT